MGLSAGTRLGPYEIGAAVGAGGMGEVYRARDTRLGRDVAIKVLPESFARDSDRLRRFEQEARTVAALNHTNILAVYDIGEHAGVPYIVCELLEGETLREKMRAGALPQRRVQEYASQIAEGLAAAHDKGVVHRDLKPENVFVGKDGRVKVLDFGLAKLARAEAAAAVGDGVTASGSAPTAPGMVLGTAGYMSPEQVRGKEVDARTDIFAFGAILYEMISGQLAFKGESSVETMNAILKEEPPELEAEKLKMSPGLERIVRRCLEKVAVVDTDGNYRQLTRAYASCHGLAWTPDGKEIWHSGSVEGEELGILAVDLSGRSRVVMRFPIEVQIQDISQSGKVLLESVRYTLEIGVKQAREKQTRNFNAGGRTDMSALSPDGRWLLLNRFRGNDYRIFLSQTNGAAPIELGDGFGSGISYDGQVVPAMRMAEPHKLFLYPTGTGALRVVDLGELTAAFSGTENGVTFSGDGRWALLAAFDSKQEIRDYLVDIRNGNVRAVTPPGSRNGKLSPDGSRVATLDVASQKTMIVDVATGKTEPLPGMKRDEQVLGWSADGRALTVWDQQLPAHIFLIDLTSGRRQLVQVVEPFTTVGSMYARMVASSDGTLAAYRQRRGLYTIYLADALN